MLIWQENVTIIVMLTNLIEGTKVHAVNYFFFFLQFSLICFIKTVMLFHFTYVKLFKANNMHIAFEILTQ